MKNIILYIAFVLNTIATSIYIIFHFLNIEILDKLDLSLLLIYDIITLVILSEIAFREKSSEKGDKSNN